MKELILGAAGVWFWGWSVPLLANGDTSGFPWQAVVANGGAFSMLAWFLYYTTAVSGPRKDAEHRTHVQEIVKTVDGLSETFKDAVDAFRAELKEAREWHDRNGK